MWTESRWKKSPELQHRLRGRDNIVEACIRSAHLEAASVYFQAISKLYVYARLKHELGRRWWLSRSQAADELGEGKGWFCSGEGVMDTRRGMPAQQKEIQCAS